MLDGRPYALGLPLPPGGPVPQPTPGRRVTALLPLTGPNAEVGQSLQRAAQLALDAPGAPELDVRDTRGTPDGAALAARDALAAGTGLFIGPLTAQETDAVAPVAQAAGVPVLAFTSDATKARPGVWTLGITPQQQVRRLVLAVQMEGKSRLAAVVPDNPFGNALADGLNTATAQAGLPPPNVRRYSGSFRTLDTAMKEVSDYAARRSAIEERRRAAAPASPASPDSEAGRRGTAAADPGAAPQAPPDAALPPPPLPFDALLLGAVGEQAGQTAPLLAAYDMRGEGVRLLGPALWARDPARLSVLAGAWYAAPDPAQRTPFEQRYSAKYGAPPRDLASLAYDAAGIARASSTPAGFDPTALLRPDGFGGADGVLALMPDGQVRRGLAIFEIDRGGSHVVQPSPGSFSAPGT